MILMTFDLINSLQRRIVLAFFSSSFFFFFLMISAMVTDWTQRNSGYHGAEQDTLHCIIRS